MEKKLITCVEKDLTATICLDEFDNSLFSIQFIEELTEQLVFIEDKSSCKFIVIRGSKKNQGKNYHCSHSDDKQTITLDILRKWENLLRLIEKIDKVTVAVIEGNCFGAGIQLALACDFRIATNNSRFMHNEVKLGILPGHSTFQLGKYCGLGRMMELLQTGKIYSAAEAVEWGIIQECCESSEIEANLKQLLQNHKISDIDVHTLIRRLAKEAYEMSYEEFIGCYLAAQHRVISSSKAPYKENAS